jgi:hypothetical protein
VGIKIIVYFHKQIDLYSYNFRMIVHFFNLTFKIWPRIMFWRYITFSLPICTEGTDFLSVQDCTNTGRNFSQATVICMVALSNCGFNLLKTKRRPLYLKPQSVPRCKHFSSWLYKRSVYFVCGTSRCLFSDKYKTHKYSVVCPLFCMGVKLGR